MSTMHPHTLLASMESDRIILQARRRADVTLKAMANIDKLTRGEHRAAKARAEEKAWVDDVLKRSQQARATRPKPAESLTSKIAGVLLAVLIGIILSAVIVHGLAR